MYYFKYIYKLIKINLILIKNLAFTAPVHNKIVVKSGRRSLFEKNKIIFDEFLYIYPMAIKP